MPEIPSWVWTVVAAFLFIPALTRVMTWFAARGLRLQPGSHKPVSEAAPAGWELEVLKGADAVLTPLGFRFVGYGLHTEEIAGTPCSHHEAYQVHESGLAWAVVRPAHHPSPQCPFLISWFTVLEDGSVLWTRNLDPSLGDALVPWLKSADRYDPTWESVEEFHRRRVADSGANSRPRIVAREALIALRDKACREGWEARRESDRMRLDHDGLGRFSLAGTWEAARTMIRFRPPLFKAYQDWIKQPRVFPLPPLAEAECYRRGQRVQPKADGWGKALLVVASLGAAALLWGEEFTPAFAAAFVAVLFVHEMGHALMMRLVGYRDVNIFFIPFFGAMATGKPGKVLHPWQEALILLAGPLPGLVGGAWLFNSSLAEAYPIARQAGLLALTINGLNLLPISPLDGGRILDLVLFRRTPRLGIAFLVLSASALIAGAIAAADAILGLVGASILLGAVRAYRQARILADVRKERQAGREASDPAEDLFLRLRSAGGNPLPFIHKQPQLKAMLASLHTRAPGAWSIIGILSLYGGAWIVPFAMLATLAPRGAGSAEVEVAREALPPAGMALYDRVCADPSVVRLSVGERLGKTYFIAMSITSDDTSRIRNLYDTDAAENTLLRLEGPAWRIGDLDSTLLRGLPAPWLEDPGFHDLPEDTVLARESLYFARLDSVSAREAGLWRSWHPERRLSKLIALEEKARARGRPWNCWKAPAAPD